jgi:hypothetical protein
MSDISVGDAVGAGFQLILRRPLSVLLWGLLRVGFVVAVIGLYLPVVAGMIAQIPTLREAGEPPQAAVAQMMSHVVMLQGLGFLVQIAGLLVSSVLYCAVTRAVLHPERSTFGYVRLGAPEFFLMVLSFAAGFVLFFCIMIFMIPFIIAIIFLATQHQWAAMGVVIALAVLVLIVGLILIALRFAFVVPMMVDDGKFHLFESWTLTKGRVGSLFLIGLCLLLIALLLEIVLGIVFVGLAIGTLTFAAGGLANIPTLFQQHQQDLAALIPVLAPSLILLALLMIPVQGGLLAIFIAPWARAYRDVLPPPPAAVAAPVPPAPPPPPDAAAVTAAP